MKPVLISPACRAIWRRRPSLVLGISPFNSYFSESRIRALARWALSRSADLHYYVPDGPSAFTLIATGDDPATAKRKAQKQARYLLNKIRRAHASATNASADEPHIICSDVLDSNAAYQRRLHEVELRYANDPVFREGCMETSAWIIRESSRDLRNIETAAKYLLAELPMFLWSHEVIDVDNAAFCYKECPDFVRSLLNATPRDLGTAFCIVDVPEESIEV